MTSSIAVFLICKTFILCMECESSEVFLKKQKRLVRKNKSIGFENSDNFNILFSSGYFEKRHIENESYVETTTSNLKSDTYKTTISELVNINSPTKKVELDENFKLFTVDGNISSTPNITSHLHCNLTYVQLEFKEKPVLNYNIPIKSSEFPVHMSWVIAISSLIFAFVVLIAVKKYLLIQKE